MQILIQFYLNSKTKTPSLLFWSCVLDTSSEDKDIDFNYLNKENVLEIKGFSDLFITVNYKKYTEEIKKDEYKETIKRPAIFLSCDETFLCGSPYHQASAQMTTFYQNTALFLSKLEKLTGFESSGYQSNQLLKNIISSIKDFIGINLIDSASVPGALSVYKKLPSFDISGHFNEKKHPEERYVIVKPCDGNDYEKDYTIEIEIFEKDSHDQHKKILYKSIKGYIPFHKYNLPVISDLEGFSQLHITIFDTQGKPLFEEYCHFIRSINLNTSIYTGVSKYVQNRFSLNKKEIVPISANTITSTIGDKGDFADIDMHYKDFIFGQDKYLKSWFFDKTDTGKKAFRSWVSKITQTAKAVTIQDPYFDRNGFNDFYSCVNSFIDLTLITAKPKDLKSKIEYPISIEELQNHFSHAKIYYTAIENIHDRYLVIGSSEERKLYSLSNSWNGSVNNYSLLVQEIPLESSLKVWEEISSYVKPENLQPLKKKPMPSREDSDEYTEAFLKEIIATLQDTDSSLESKQDAAYKIIKASGNGKFNELKAKELVNNMHSELSIENRAKALKDVVKKLLEKQKERFIQENRIPKENPLSHYDTPEKSLEKIERTGPARPYYNYKISHAEFGMLNSFFISFPKDTFTSLEDIEKKVCILKTKEGDIPYFVSESIIHSLIWGNFGDLEKVGQQLQDFIKGVKDLTYIKTLLAYMLLGNISSNTLEDILSIFKKLLLNKEEILIMLSFYYKRNSSLRFRWKQLQHAKERQVVLEDIENYIIKEYPNVDIVRFADKVFISEYKLNFKAFLAFLSKISEVSKHKDIEDLLLIKSVAHNNKLQSRMIELIAPAKYVEDYAAASIREGADDDFEVKIDKFIDIVPILGGILAKRINTKEKEKAFCQISNQLNVDKTLIFPTLKYPNNMGAFYYEVLYILNAWTKLKKKIQKEDLKLLELLQWYLVPCLNRAPEDYHGLSITVIDLYTSILSEKGKKSFYKLLTNGQCRVLTAVTFKKQSKNFMSLYKKFLEEHEIAKYNDESKSVRALLNICINISLSCAEQEDKFLRENLLTVLDVAISKADSLPKVVQDMLQNARKYAISPGSKTKEDFKKSLDESYVTYSAVSILGMENE